MNKMNSIILWWQTPKFPVIHLSDKTSFIKKWFFHPIKRRVARFYLKLLQKFTGIKVIAITGSAGKTTTKEMIVSILKLDGKTSYTPQNIDPTYNIASTILKTMPGTKYLILEMGVEYPGEMDFYLWLAKPDLGIVTNIFPTHTEFLGNIEGVFAEKSKLVTSLDKNDFAVLNSGDKLLKSLKEKINAKISWFEPNIDPIVQNANAAKIIVKTLGVRDEFIKKGIENYERPPHRLNLIRHKSGAIILDDSYNSNPWAAVSSLEYFNKLARGKKIAVLGDMLELGNYDEIAHRELGLRVAKSDFQVVIGIGKSSRFMIDEVEKKSKNTKAYLFDEYKKALPVVRGLLKKDVSILVKGSHSIHLDRLVDSLT